MKKIFVYIPVALSFILIFSGCFTVQRIMKGEVSSGEYKGWYVSTSTAIFFILERQGLFKKDIMFSFPEHSKECYPPNASASFFYSDCKKNSYGDGQFIVDGSESTAFNANVFLCRAKVFFQGFDSTSVLYLSRGSNSIIHKVKVNYRMTIKKALLVDAIAYSKRLVLYSNCTSDSIVYSSCWDNVSNW